jgi:hypothetical protein
MLVGNGKDGKHLSRIRVSSASANLSTDKLLKERRLCFPQIWGYSVSFIFGLTACWWFERFDVPMAPGYLHIDAGPK